MQLNTDLLLVLRIRVSGLTVVTYAFMIWAGTVYLFIPDNTRRAKITGCIKISRYQVYL
jgi:hypothetical protein